MAQRGQQDVPVGTDKTAAAEKIEGGEQCEAWALGRLGTSRWQRATAYATRIAYVLCSGGNGSELLVW